jgi:hypothetical protein
MGVAASLLGLVDMSGKITDLVDQLASTSDDIEKERLVKR